MEVLANNGESGGQEKLESSYKQRFALLGCPFSPLKNIYYYSSLQNSPKDSPGYDRGV